MFQILIGILQTCRPAIYCWLFTCVSNPYRYSTNYSTFAFQRFRLQFQILIGILQTIDQKVELEQFLTFQILIGILQTFLPQLCIAIFFLSVSNPYRYSTNGLDNKKVNMCSSEFQILIGILQTWIASIILYWFIFCFKSLQVFYKHNPSLPSKKPVDLGFKSLQVFYKLFYEFEIRDEDACFKSLQVFYKPNSLRGGLDMGKAFQILIGILQTSNRMLQPMLLFPVSNPYRYSTNRIMCEICSEKCNVSNPYRYSTNTLPKISEKIIIICFKSLQVFYKRDNINKRLLYYLHCFKSLQVFYKHTIPSANISVFEVVSNPYRYSTNRIYC